jgi:cell division protein ZapA
MQYMTEAERICNADENSSTKSIIVLQRFKRMAKPPYQTIKLLNKSYKIKCPVEERANLKRCAEKLNEQLLKNKAEFDHLTDYQLLLLSALNISHELIHCQAQQTLQREQLNHFISALGDRMNQPVTE